MEEVMVLITQESAKITCNFDQVKKAIQETLEEYQGAVFTEESKTYAKKTIASLRAQKKTFQDNLKTEKQKYMQPWDKFETQARELIALYDEPIDFINGQVQAFEEKRKAEKKQTIMKIYNEIVPNDLQNILPVNQIYNSRWENATFREAEIRDEISDIVRKTQKDIETIKGMNSEAAEKALQAYNNSLDLTEAIAMINAYERHKQEILAREQERLRHEEEERVRREERAKMLTEQRAIKEKEEAERRAKEALEEAAQKAEEEKAAAIEQAKKEAAQEVIDNLIPSDVDEEAELYEYRMFLTPDAKEKLERYMNSVGIEWEEIA